MRLHLGLGPGCVASGDTRHDGGMPVGRPPGALTTPVGEPQNRTDLALQSDLLASQPGRLRDYGQFQMEAPLGAQDLTCALRQANPVGNIRQPGDLGGIGTAGS